MKKVCLLFNLPALLCLICLPAWSQTSLTKGDIVQNIPANKILNHITAVSSLSKLQNKVTIIDFFGTWCVPCLKALPNLTGIQQRFKNDVNIILVSNETAIQLTTFIRKQNNFEFPIVVDESNQWYQNFQPPSLPYTVILNPSGKIVDITDAGSITDKDIMRWLGDTVGSVSKRITIQDPQPNVMNTNTKSSNQNILLSQNFLYSAKTGESVEKNLLQLKDLDFTSLVTSLQTDQAKKTFWINLYNGFTQVLLQKNPEAYKNRNAFFGSRTIEVARHKLSLDDIEHGILRRSKIKWSLGYLNKIFTSKNERQLRVSRVDYRIHFALNCGAKSCPPIAFYDAENLDKQLNIATKSYLAGEASYEKAENTVSLPSFMNWFRADFKGKKGMRIILKKHQVIPEDVNPKIKFLPYNWNLSLHNFTK